MKTILKAAVLAATAMTASLPLTMPAHAQTAQAQIVIVDMDDVIGDSAAGKAAQTTLQAQANALQTRVKTLSDGFRNEQEALVKARDAKTMTDAALQAKVKDLQGRQQTAQTEIAGRERQLQASQRYVVEQIDKAAQPIITAIMKEKGATIALARGATIQAANTLDITNEVVRRLNAALPSVSTTPPTAAAPAK